MMNGSDFLDKLEDLDPDLIQAAAQAPASKPRRVWDFGAWIAAAACLCALFLPWILGQAIPPRDNKEAVSDASSNTSHQLEAGGEETAENVEEGADAAKGISPQTAAGAEAMMEGEAQYRKTDFITETVADSEGNTWTAVILDEAYQAGFPAGRLPAEEYFSHNAQTQSPVPLANEFDSLSFRGETTFAQSEPISKILPDLGDSRYPDQSPLIFGDYDEKDQLSQLQISWCMKEWDEEKGVTARNITATVSTQNPADPDTEAQAKAQQGETRVLRDGVTVTALGSPGQERTLSFQRDGMYYRIYAPENIPDEHMLTVLDWLLGDSFRLELFSKENGRTLRQEGLNDPEDIPSAFAGYYPAGPQWDQAMDSGLVDYLNGKPTALELIYDSAAQPLIRSWRIAREDAEIYPFPDGTESLGELSGLTESRVEEACRTLTGFGGVLSLHFTWDDYNATIAALAPEGAKEVPPEEIWEFIQYLQGQDKPKSS